MNPHRRFGRLQLAETVWGDNYHADIMKALRQELWLIRRAFRATNLNIEDYIAFENDEIGVIASVNVDASEFEQKLQPFVENAEQFRIEENIDQLETAIDLYQGDLLPGLYDHWCLFPRELLRDKYIIAVERMMVWRAGQQDWSAALLYGKKLLETDPLLEHVHRDIMRFHYARGDRPAALRQYSLCRDQLRRDLTIKPMVDTTALYQAIREENDAAILTKAFEGWAKKSSPANPLVSSRHKAPSTARPTEAAHRLSSTK